MEMAVKICIAIILLLFSAALEEAVSQDLRENLSRSLFSDQKANRVGDAVTILVIETSSASNDAKTATSRASDISLAANAQTGSASSTATSCCRTTSPTSA